MSRIAVLVVLGVLVLPRGTPLAAGGAPAGPDRTDWLRAELARAPEGAEHLTNEGTVQLAWRVGDAEIGSTDLQFQVQRGRDPSFAAAEIHYEGPENGTFVSGLPGGTFYFRVRAFDHEGRAGPWSAPARRGSRRPSRARRSQRR